MGTSALMSLGTRAMYAAFAQLQVTGQNIANANVEGYSRQTAELATATGQYTGAGFFGKGVDVATVKRAHDDFLTREATAAGSLAAMDQVRHEQLVRLEAAFPTGEQGVGYAAGELLNAMVDLASRPQDIATREVVLARAQEVAQRFALAGRQLDSLQAGVTQDLKNAVASVNELAQRIADLNQQIALVQGAGHAPNDLLDQRDQLVKQLGEQVAVTTIPADDGTLGVFIAGGQRLVLGNQAQSLVVIADALDPSRAAIGMQETGGVLTLSSSLLTGGTISGLLRFQNEDLVGARTAIGQMAVAFADRVNEQLSLGLDLREPPGAGAALFAVGAPQALPASTNARDAGGNYVASVQLSVDDASLLRASEYELRTDPATPGNYLLTRLSDGLVRSVASGDVVDGLRIDVSGTPAATDRFLLQPVSRAAAEMRRVLDDPRGIAAASPLTASVVPTNTGTARVGGLTMTAPLASNDAVAVTFGATVPATPPATVDGIAYTWTRGATSGAGVWTPGQPLAIDEFAVTLTGVPASGDRLDVAPTPFPASNNGNALALAALRDETFIGRRLDMLGNVVGGETITDAYASAMAGIGVRVQSARTSAEISASAKVAAEQQQASKAGVNLDEEAARLIQFQQSYQAAAKVLQVAQQVFDTLLSTAAR